MSGRLDLLDVYRDEDTPTPVAHPLTGRTFETERGTATIIGPADWSDQYLLIDVDLGDGAVLHTTALEALVRGRLLP